MYCLLFQKKSYAFTCAHCTPPFNFMSGMGIFRASVYHPSYLRFPLHVQHSSDKDEFHIKKSIGYCVLKPHAIPAFYLLVWRRELYGAVVT
jgi:hypothetical protein